MDFENMKRKQLQALCKEHGIPANLTNLEMVNKLSSLLKVNDEKPLTRGRSCLKITDDNVNDRESDVVNRKVKKVKFSPDNEVIEFTRSVGVKRRGRGKSMLYKNDLNVGILDSPVRVTRSGRVNMEEGVTEKKGGKRRVKDSVISVDEVGLTTRSLRNKEVVIVQEKKEENEGGNDGLKMSRRVRSRKNGKESVADTQEELTIVSGGQMNECTKSETDVKETKRVTRRKSMAHNQTLLVQNEVDAEVREEVVEKPVRVTRARNLKPVEDNLSNKRNRSRGKEAIETSEELLRTEFVESSVEAVKEEIRVNTRRSRQNSVMEAPHEALKKSGRVANKTKGVRLVDDISKEKMGTRGRTRNQSNLTVEASTSESGTKLVEPEGKHEAVLQPEEQVEVHLRRSDRRKSVCPLENLRGDEVADKKEKRNVEETQKALKRSKRLAPQVEDSVLAKDDIAENEVVLQTVKVPVRSNRRKSVVPSLEKVRSDEVAVVKERRNLNGTDDEIRSKGTKEEPQKASKRPKRLAKQMEDPVLAKGDIAENKLEERRCSRRNAAKANADTNILDRSVQEETSVVKEEKSCYGRNAAKANADTKIPDRSVQEETSVVKEDRRSSGRSPVRQALAAVSDDKKEKSENKLTKRNCTVVQENDSSNKFALQDLESLKQSPSGSKASVKAAVVKKTSTAGKKQQGRPKRSNVEVEVLLPEDMEIVSKPDNKDCDNSGSAGSMSFSRSSMNEQEPVPDDVNIVLAGTKDDTTAESSTLADKLNEEKPLTDANSSPSESNSAAKSLPFKSNAKPEENLEELLMSDNKDPAIKGLCPSSVLADDALPNDISSDKQEPGAIAADNSKEFGTALSNEVLENCSVSQSGNTEENLDSAIKDEAGADKLNEEGQLADANASPSENKSTSKCLPLSDPFNTNVRPEENLVEELLQSGHEEPTSKGLCPSSVLADDALPNDITSDKQEPGAIAADNAEEFDTVLSNEVLDNCSLSPSDNMEENLDSGTKDEAAAELSTLADKLNVEGPLVDANASPSENISTSKCLPLSDPFNSNIRPDENLVEELLQSDYEEPASKGICPSFVLAEDAVLNDITSDKQESGAIAADNAEEFDAVLSNEVLDNCSLSLSDNMEENLDPGIKDEAAAELSSQADKLIEEGPLVDANVSPSKNNSTPNSFNSSARLEENQFEELQFDHEPPASKDVCPSSVFAEDAVPNEITSDKHEHGSVAADNAEGLSDEVLDNCSLSQRDNMEENLDSGFKEQLETGYVVNEGITYGDQEPAIKDQCSISALADEALPNDITPDKPEHGAIVADTTEGFDTGSANEVLDNFSENQTDNMEEKLDFDSKEQPETQCIVSVGVNNVEQEQTIMDYAKEFDAGLPSNVSLDNVGAFHQSNEMQVKNSKSGPMEQAEAESGPVEQAEAESDPMEQAEAESDLVEAKYDLDAPTFTSQGEIHSEEYANLEAAASVKTVSSPIKAVPDVEEPGILGDGITLHETPLEDGDEEKQGEELNILFATPCYVSRSKKEKKASLDGDSRDEGLNKEGQGEYLKSLFATPFGSRSSKVELATCVGVNETNSHYKHSFHEDESTGEELKGLFATPSAVSQSVGGQHYLFKSQLSGEAMTTREGFGSSGKENLSESVSGLIQDTQVEHVRTPTSVKCTNQEITSTKGKYSKNHEMETSICSGVERNLGESEAGSVGVDQAPETSQITPFNYGDEKQEYQSKMMFDSPIITQSLDQMDGTSRKTADRKQLLSGNVQGLSHNKVFPVSHPSSMDLEEPERIDLKYSETAECMKKSRALEKENNEGQGNMLSATSAKSMAPVWSDEFSSQEPTIKETAEYMKESCALEEENYEGQGNMLSATSAKNLTPLWSVEFSSQEPTIKDTAECMKESSALEEENNDGQGNMLSATSAKNMTPLRNDEDFSQEPKKADVAKSGEEHKIEETVVDRDLLLRDTSRDLEEDIYVGIANESTSVTSNPTCNDDIGFSEQKTMPEINNSSLENVETSDAFNEGTEDHLKLLFATPIKGTSPSRLGEASSSQLKTAMIAMASEMVGKQPDQGFEFSGEPLTVDIISGGSNSTERSCFSKELEQFERGRLFPTPSKGTTPLQLEESPGCLEDIFKDLDGEKFLNSHEQNFAERENQLLNEMTEDIGEATLHWFKSNGGSVPRQTGLETQKENDPANPFEPLHEKGEVTVDGGLAEGKEDDHLAAYQESLENRLINTDEAAKDGAVSDAVCQQPNILLTDIEMETITQESIRKTDGSSASAESGILEFDAESTALRSQETIIVTVEEIKEDEVQKLEVRSTCNAFSHSIPNDDEYAKEISTVLPADEQFHFPEHYVIENVLSTEEFTASTNECQHVSKDDDLAAESDRLVICESNESTSMNVHDSGLTTQMDHSALSEEPRSESALVKSSAAKQQDEDSFDKKEHESTEAVLSPSNKSRENISFNKEGFADEDTLMAEKKNELAKKKVPLTPAGVGKSSFAKHMNSTVKKKNARSILIHGTPNKLTQIADMKENAPSVKGDIGTLTALRPEKRLALKNLPWK